MTLEEMKEAQNGTGEYARIVMNLNDSFFQMNSIFDDIYYKFKAKNCHLTANEYHKPIAHKFPEMSDKFTEILDTIGGQNFGWQVKRPNWERTDFKALSTAAVNMLLDFMSTLQETKAWFRERYDNEGFDKLFNDLLEDAQELMIVPVAFQKFIEENNPNVIDLETFADLYNKARGN